MKNLKDAVIKTLTTGFPAIPCYDEEIPQGFARPAFMVEVLPVNSRFLNAAHIQREAMISIEYYPQPRTNEACYTMADSLTALFAGVLVMGGRVLQLGDIEQEVIRKELTVLIGISYIDSLDETQVHGYDPTTELMGTLTTSESLNEE